MRQVLALLDAGQEADAHQWEQVGAKQTSDGPIYPPKSR